MNVQITGQPLHSLSLTTQEMPPTDRHWDSALESAWDLDDATA
jgi:hypothetical protein